MINRAKQNWPKDNVVVMPTKTLVQNLIELEPNLTIADLYEMVERVMDGESEDEMLRRTR